MTTLGTKEIGATMLGFEQVETLHASTYRDSSTVIVCPTLGKIDYRVVESWNNLIRVPNQRRSFLFCEGAEVGDAYNQLVERVLSDYSLSRYKYLLTVEDDNILPADAHLMLLDAIQSGPWDAVAGLYFARREPHQPLAMGEAGETDPFGGLDFKPVDVREAIKSGLMVEVNGVPMGCTIFRLDLFREMPRPWFTTVNTYAKVGDKFLGRRTMTHDLAFCEQAKLMGKRFAVHCGVRVGHLDAETNRIF